MTYYELLGVDPSATPAEIHAAYRARARQVHPDHAGRGAAGTAMADINEAWHVLRDPARRADYDTSIGRRAPGSADGGTPPRTASTPPHDRPGPDTMSGPSSRLLRGLLATAMILTVLALTLIVLIGFLQGP